MCIMGKTLRAGEWKVIIEGSGKKVWTRRRDKAPVLWWEEEEWWPSI